MRHIPIVCREDWTRTSIPLPPMQAAYKNQLAYFVLYFYEPSVGIEPTSADYETAIIAFILRGRCGGNRSRTDIWWVKATHTQPLYDTAVEIDGLEPSPVIFFLGLYP